MGRKRKYENDGVLPSGHTLLGVVSGGKHPKWRIRCGSCREEKVLWAVHAVKRTGCGCEEQPNRERLIDKALDHLAEDVRRDIAMERVIGKSFAEIRSHFNLNGKLVNHAIARTAKKWKDDYKDEMRSNPGFVATVAATVVRDGLDVAVDTFYRLNNAKVIVICELAIELRAERDHRNLESYMAGAEEALWEHTSRLADDYVEAKASDEVAA